MALSPRTKARRRRGAKTVGRPLPYSYIPGKSFIHRLDAGWKLLALFLISTLAFSLGIPFLLPGTLLVAACSLAAGIRSRQLLRGIRPLQVTALLVTLCRSFAANPGGAIPVAFSRRGFEEGLVFGWSILLAFCAASLFFSTTTMTQIKDSLDRFRLQRLSLALSLMLGFLPRFFAVWEGAELAYRARDGKKGLPQLIALTPLVMERMILSAGETATALEARGLWRRAGR
jgi:biotin transport system permease protein